MKSVRSLLLLLTAVSISSTSAEDEELKLPSYIEVCYRDDPKVAACLKRNIENLIVKFKSGSKDFDLASLDPMKFRDINLSYKSFIVGGDVDIPKLDIFGLSNLTVVDVRPKTNIPGEFVLDFDTKLPTLNLKTNYNMTGNFFTMPMHFDGFTDMIFDRALMTYHITGEVRTKGDTDFLELTEFQWRFRGEGIRNAYLRNSDIVNGRPALSRALSTAMTNNWKILRAHLLPVVYPLSDVLMRDMFTKFFAKYPYDILFPRRTRI